MRYQTIPLLILIAGSLSFTPTGVFAQQKDNSKEAEAHFKRCAELYNEADYKLALIECKRAYELAPTYKILYNIGHIDMMSNRYADALRALEKYLRDGGDKVDAKRRAEVSKEIASLKTRTAHVEFTSDVEGVDVSLDELPIGKTPFSEPLLIDAGDHKITATKAGRTTFAKYITLAGGDRIKVQLELPEEPNQPAPAPTVIREVPVPQPTASAPPPDQEEKPKKLPGGIFVGWLATGALAAVAGAFGAAAISRDKELDNLNNDIGSSQTERDAKAKEVKTLSLTADILGAGAVLAGGISLVATIVAVSSSGSSSKRSSRMQRVDVSVGPTGARFGGAF